MFKWVYAAGKMYALTIPTDLKLSGGPDGTDKWVTPAMIKPVRLGLIHHFEPIENRDGQPLAKNLDVWIKDHFPEFAAIKLKSLANCRAWLQPSKFASHVAAVADLHEITIKKAIAAATGSDEPAAANKKGAANAHTVAAASAESARVAALSLSLPLLNRIREVWAIAAAVIAVPIGQRIIEIDLASELVDVQSPNFALTSSQRRRFAWQREDHPFDSRTRPHFTLKWHSVVDPEPPRPCAVHHPSAHNDFTAFTGAKCLVDAEASSSGILEDPDDSSRNEWCALHTHPTGRPPRTFNSPDRLACALTPPCPVVFCASVDCPCSSRSSRARPWCRV